MVLDPDMRWPYPDSDRVGRASKDRRRRRPLHRVHQELLPGPSDPVRPAHRHRLRQRRGLQGGPLALEELGAEVFRLGTGPNGTNINDHCGSLHPETLAAKVREVRADVGLALDGDADRLIVVDEKGNVLDGDQLMALGAQAMMERGELPGNMLVATAMSNLALEIFMKERAGTLLRTKVGDRYVMEAMRKTGAMLGGEQSGHLIYRQYSTTGDGLLAALQLLRIVREKEKPLSELAGLLHLFPQKLINVRVEKEAALRGASRHRQGCGRRGKGPWPVAAVCCCAIPAPRPCAASWSRPRMKTRSSVTRATWPMW